MSRKPAQGAKGFADKFVNTPISVDNGIYGKMYTILLPHCKVLMNYRHRQSYPQIEMIRFPNILLVVEPHLWDSAYLCYQPYREIPRLISPSANIQNSREIDRDSNGAILQLGDDKYFISKLTLDRGILVKVDKSIFSSSSNSGGKTLCIPIKREINTVDKVISTYFEDHMFLINGNILAVPSIEEDIPKLEHYFSKSELELIDNPPASRGIFVREECYHQYFGHNKSAGLKEIEALVAKSEELREKLKNRRYCDSLRYSLSSFIWHPGCETIANSENYMYMRGPWEIKNTSTSRQETWSKYVSERWHTLYAL